MFYSVEAAMANYRDKSSQPSKLDGCVNQHRYKIAKDSFYENFSLKNQFCLLYHDDDDSLDSCKLKGIINAIMKYIEDAPMKMQYSIDFAKDVRKKLLCLHYDISGFLKRNNEFPFSSELHNLLVHYIEFEHDILYHPKNFSKEYQKAVEQKVLYLLLNIFYDPIGVSKKLVNSPEEASAMSSLYILKHLKPEYKKSQGLIENMMCNLLARLELLDEINEIKRQDSVMNLDKLLKASKVQKWHKYLASRNYYDNDDFNNSDDEFNMEIEDIVAMKQEIKVEHYQTDDIELIVSSNQQCITIDLDSDSEDCHTLDVRKNTLDLNMKRAHSGASLSNSRLNSFTTSNICDNKRLRLNSDKSRVLDMYNKENRLSDTNSCNLSNSRNGYLRNKIQNGTTKRNVVGEVNSDEDTRFHMIYEDSQYENIQLRKELLLLDNDEHLCIPSKLYDVTEKLKRYIDECPKSIRYTRRFVNGIHRTLIYLYESMCRLVKGNREFLSSSELHTLLVTYMELEYEVLYDSKNFSIQYEETVQIRILHLLLNMLFNPTVDGSIKQYVKSAEEASALSTLYIVRSIKPEYKKQHSLVENIMHKLMLKLNVLDNINDLRSKNKDIQLNQLLKIPQFNKIYKYLHNRDILYGIDDYNSSDHLDMVEVKPSIKNEEIDIKPDVAAYYHLDKRKPVVIDLDEEDDDCFMISDAGIETVVKTEENSSEQNLFDNVLIKIERNSNNSDDYSVSNLCNNNQSNACVIVIDDDDEQEEEGSGSFENNISSLQCVPNISDELEEELLQLEDAAGDIESEDENEVLNRFTDDEFDTNEKIITSCDSFEKRNCSSFSDGQTTTVAQQLSSIDVETSNDRSKTNILLQNEVSIDVLEGTISNSCSSSENIDKSETNKSVELSSLINDEINSNVTDTNNCSSDATVESNLMSHINLDLADCVDVGEVTNTANSDLKSPNENHTIEKDLLESSTSILNTPSNSENLSSAVNDVPNINSEIQVLNETDSNVIINNVQEIHHTTSISEEKGLAFTTKNSPLNIQDATSDLHAEVNQAHETDLNIKSANECHHVQHSTLNTECLKEFDSTSKESTTTNLNEQDERDNLNLEIDDSLNKNCEIQKDVNSKTSILLGEETSLQDNEEQISNKPPQEFTETIKLLENDNLNAIENETNITSESSDLVENKIIIFQEENVVDVCEDAQLLLKNDNSDTIENEITSESTELLLNEESIIHTDLEKKIDIISERFESLENEESSIVTTEYDKEIAVSVEKKVNVACENSESFESESVIVCTENELPEVHEDLFIGHTELNTVEDLEVHAEVDVVSDDLNEELCVLEDQAVLPEKEIIEDLQSTAVEHLEVQKVIEVTSENDEMCDDEHNASKLSLNFQDDDYVKETIKNEEVIENDATEEDPHIDKQDPIAVDGNKSSEEEGLKTNVTFNNLNNNLLSVLAQVASEQQKMENGLEMESKKKAIKEKRKEKGSNKRKQNAINKKLKKSPLAVKRVTRSSSLKAKENLEVEVDACNYPSNFKINLENYVSPPPHKVYDLIIPIASVSEESVDGSDSDLTNQQLGDAQLNTFSIKNSVFDEDTIEDGIEFICHNRKNKIIETSISKCGGSVLHPLQEIDGGDTFNIETNNKSQPLKNVEYTSLNFQIKTTETFTRRDINNQFNVQLLLNREEENKSLKTKSKQSAKKKSKKVIKNDLKCAEFCVNNDELDNVKTTPKKNRRSKLEQTTTEKQLNKTKNQKSCLDSVSIKTESNKRSDIDVHVPHKTTEEIIVQDLGVENVTEAELEIEVITEETCETSDIQIDAEDFVPNNGEENNIALNKNAVPIEIDLISSNAVTNKNREEENEECLTANILNSSEKVEADPTGNNYQKCTIMIEENENIIHLNTQKPDFVPESDSRKEKNGKIVDNEELNSNKSTKLRNSKVKRRSRDVKMVAKEKPTERKYKGEKKSCLKTVEDCIDATISDSPSVINTSIISSKITKQNVNIRRENMNTNKQKLKSNKFQCSNLRNIKKYIGKNNLSKKLGIRKKNKNMITKKKIKFLRGSLKKNVRRDRIKRESIKTLSKEYVQVNSNTEIIKTNQDNNDAEAPMKNERTKKKRKGKKVLPKSEFLNEETRICSPIEQELNINEIDVPSKPLENSVEDAITQNNQELSLITETELNASNNLQVNSDFIENDCIDRATENKEPISTNSEIDKIEVVENVIVNFDYEEVIQSPKCSENEVVEISKENETIRIEDQLTDANSSKESCEDIESTTAESSAAITQCNTIIIDANISKPGPCADIQSAVVKKCNATMEDQDSSTPREDYTNIHEESNIDELLKNDLPSMNTLVEEIKTIKRKLSENEHVQDQEEQLATEEYSKIQSKIQFSKIENKKFRKFSKRRSSKTDSKSKGIDSITENLRSRSYQKINKNTTQRTKIILENMNSIKSDTVVEIAEMDIERINTKIFQEENTEIAVVDDDKKNKIEKETNANSEIAAIGDNQINPLVEKEVKTNFEIAKVYDNKTNQKIEKEAMMVDDNKSNQDVEKVAYITFETTEVDDNTDKQLNVTCEITKSDNYKTNNEIEEVSNTTSKISEAYDDKTNKVIEKESNISSEITKVDDNKANKEIEESCRTTEDPNELRRDTSIEITDIDMVKTNEDRLEEINTTFESCNDIGKNELIEIVEVGNTVTSENKSEKENSISQKLVTDVDDSETNIKIIREAETIDEHLSEFEKKKSIQVTEGDDNETNEVVVKEICENAKVKCIEIAEVDDVGINSKSSEETNTTNHTEIFEVDDDQINIELSEETNAANCIKIVAVDDVKINSKSPEETNAANCMKIIAVDDVKINSKSSEETNAANCMEIVEVGDIKINSKLTEETITTNCMKVAEVDNVEISIKTPEETITSSKNVLENSEITKQPQSINNKINENTLEEINTTYKNLNELGKDYLIENSEVDNNVVQFSIDLEKTSNDSDELPTTVVEINTLNKSADDDDQDNKIDQRDLKSDKGLGEDKFVDAHQDDITENDNYCEKVAEIDKNLTSDNMDIHKKILQGCENFDKQEYKNATEIQKGCTFNDFEFSENLNENGAHYVSSATDPLIESPKTDYSVNNESEYTIEEVTIQSSILLPKNLQDIVDLRKNIPAIEILEEIVDSHGLLSSNGFEDSILGYSGKMKETIDNNCLLQIANKTIVETFQVTPSTSLCDNPEAGFVYLRGSEHNYYQHVSDPLLSADATNENNRYLNHVKEIATSELESEDNIMQFISTQSETNLNQELSTSLNETSVNNSADFQLLDQCLMENGLGHESSPPLPQRVSCDNVFQHTLKQEVTEYDENSRNSNLEFHDSSEEVNIDSFQQNQMSKEEMIQLMTVLADIKHLKNISSRSATFDANTNNCSQYILHPEQVQTSYEDVNIVTTALSRDFSDTSNIGGFANKSGSEFQENPTKLIRDILDATNSIEHANSNEHANSIPKSISFDTDFSNIYFPAINDTFLSRDKTSTEKVIVERIMQHELPKYTNVDISVATSDNHVHHSINSKSKFSATTPKKKSLTLVKSQPKFTLQLQPKVPKKSIIDNKLLLDNCLKRQNTRTRVLPPERKQLNEGAKKSEILNAKNNSVIKMETINKVSSDKDESITRSCNEVDLKKLTRRRVSEKIKLVNEDATSKRVVESKTVKSGNKQVTSYLEDLDKLGVQIQNTKESDKKSNLKSGCTTTESHSQTINFTISPPQQKVKDNFEQALSKYDLIDNVKSRKRKAVDYVERPERKKNCDVNKKLPYKGNQKKVESPEDLTSKAKGKRKLDLLSDDKDAKMKSKFDESEEKKLHNISDILLQQKEKSWEDLDISKRKKPRLSLPESNPMDVIFNRLLEEGDVNDRSNSGTKSYPNRNPVTLPSYEHRSPTIKSTNKNNMVNLQKSTSNPISIFNKGMQRTTDNRPKKIAIVAPIKSSVRKESSSRTNEANKHDWLEKMKNAFPQHFSNEVSFE